MSEDAGNDTLPCLRWHTPLTYVAESDFREGSGGGVFAFGQLGALFESSTRVEVWARDSCRHIEFFMPGAGD